MMTTVAFKAIVKIDSSYIKIKHNKQVDFITHCFLCLSVSFYPIQFNKKISLRYISLNGYRFTKEDHILFIKIFYEIISLPNVDLHYACVSIRILTTLLR